MSELVPGLVFNTRSRPRSEWLIVLEWSWGGVASAVPWEGSCSVLERIMGWSSSGLWASWSGLGASWSGLGASWSGLGASWGDLGTSWDDLEASWGSLGLSLVSFGRRGVVLGPSRAHLGAILADFNPNGMVFQMAFSMVFQMAFSMVF